MIKFTQDDFLTTRCINLASRLHDEDNSTQKVAAFINSICWQIYSYIRIYNSRFDDLILSDFQMETIKEAEMIQAEYILQNGDIRLESGWDTINKTLADSITLKDLALNHMAHAILEASGLLYRGL